MLNPTEAGGGAWELSLQPEVLLPSRDAALAVTFTPGRDLNARGVRATLIGTERYRYRRTESTGRSTHTVEHTGTEEVGRVETTLAGPGVLAAGASQRWSWSFHVPDLGPATFEADVLRCDWELAVTVDLPMAADAELRLPVRVAQPTSLLSAGVIDLGEYGLFEEAPANIDAHPAQIRLEPVPISIDRPFSGTATIETAEPVAVQEVRLELRVHAQVTVSGGEEEEIVLWQGRLPTAGGSFGGPMAAYPFQAAAPDQWLPSVDLPHGRARGAFHVILARAFARDIHYARDVGVCSTTEL